jgi:hypothetical protein
MSRAFRSELGHVDGYDVGMVFVDVVVSKTDQMSVIARVMRDEQRATRNAC